MPMREDLVQNYVGDPGSFWDEMVVPFQEEDPSFDIANPVTVSKHFLQGVAWSAYLGDIAESLMDKEAAMEIELKEAIREREILKRKILARNYKGISKSASSDVLGAYLYMVAQEEGLFDELIGLEEKINSLELQLDKLRPKLIKVRSRIKAIEKKLDWCKQWLDYDKLKARIDLSNR